MTYVYKFPSNSDLKLSTERDRNLRIGTHGGSGASRHTECFTARTQSTQKSLSFNHDTNVWKTL